MNKIYKVGIYLRLSNEDRDKSNKLDDSESIKNQRNMLIDYINKHKDFLLIDEYCDENLSGAGTYRPEFERLINDCKNHVIDIVLCKSQSRFSTSSLTKTEAQLPMPSMSSKAGLSP